MDTPEELEGLKDRLRLAKATQQDLADFMGVDLKVVNRLANPNGPDGRKRISTHEIEQIRAFFQLREKPVYSFDGPTRRGGVNAASGVSTIPLFTGIDTPDGYVLSVGNTAQHGRVLAHPLQMTAREAYAVTVIDDTMSPRFETGEVAYVVPGQPPRRGQDCLVEFDDLTARILQFVERHEKQIVCKQLHPSKPVTFRTGQVKVHAIVGRG